MRYHIVRYLCFKHRNDVVGQILWNSTPSVLNLNSGALLHGS